MRRLGVYMQIERCSGILLHPTSLPGEFGIGSFDQEAYDWIDAMVDTKQTVWQVLPLGPTGYGDSPYQSSSTHAGNPYLIGLRKLAEQGLLDEQELRNVPAEVTADPSRVDYGAIYVWKLGVLRRAAANLNNPENGAALKDFQKFCFTQSSWLRDYALFMALKDANPGLSWNEWTPELRDRHPQALKQAQAELNEEVRAYSFMQWVFFRQWSELRRYANQRGIKILGDLPIFVSMESSDIWANPEQFCLDERKRPTCVAGVPPDCFSEDGQLWGNPLYNWKVMREKRYSWWLRRIESALARYDFVRLDHFRGFHNYWEIPAESKTAREGQWVLGPGEHFFKALQKKLGRDLPFVAEDLGSFSEGVPLLRDKFNLPGMKILQFAFNNDSSHPFLPHNYPQNCVAYTGTHDNDTTRGWYEHGTVELNRDHFRRYFATDGWDMTWTMIRGIFSSCANLAIVPIQDILDLGSEHRMNRPGENTGNWTWRMLPGQFNEFFRQRLRDMTVLYGRAPRETEEA